MFYLKKIAKKIKSGVLIQISLTMRCTLDCSYCCQKILLGHRPMVHETSFTGWVRWFERFPYPIKEVYVSGGEPTLHPDFVRIVNYLIGKGYFVKVFTNLMTPGKLFSVIQSYRFSIKATYHHSQSKEQFDHNYQKVREYHSVYIDEIEDPKRLTYSTCQPMLSGKHSPEMGKDFYDIACLRISPDLHINLNCYELVSDH
jgi:MoaA/NifB/PqqE/SkfB family radical SAM enzyme